HAIKPALAGWHGEVAALKRRHAMNYDRASTLIQPCAVIEAINRHTQGRAIVSTGVGQHAAIGAQFAQRDKLVIDIDGDASIRMNIGELETVTTYNLPLKIVVLNNVGDGMVRQWQKLYFKGRFAASDKSLHKKDFVLAAQADGFAWARRLERHEDLESTIAAFLGFDGPAFLEVMIDPDAGVYPMVGPGASYAQMITGDFIASRAAPAAIEVHTSHMF